ncbi:MAG: helix-turn-helix domain-containing protein [Proteobacteria bacterium]|nr:helix-turn-helix domain-containing protein [Pseudomonadota bacterium]
MKRLTEQDYYSLLDISPKASFEEVRSAYDQAMSIYSTDSISTYTLFTQKEKELILSRLAEAYKTLTNNQLRKEYNHFLIERGELFPQEIGFSSMEDSNIAKGKLLEVSVESLTQKQQKVKDERVPSSKNLTLFDSQISVTGKSIKIIRTSKEMSLEEIFKQTNISRETLEDIEEERFEKLPALVYLKGFLKAYAKILQVNQTEMVDGYVKRYLEWKNTYQK